MQWNSERNRTKPTHPQRERSFGAVPTSVQKLVRTIIEYMVSFYRKTAENRMHFASFYSVIRFYFNSTLTLIDYNPCSLSSAKKKSQRSVHERCDETDNGISRLDNALLQPRRCGTPAKPTPSVPLPCRHDDNSDTVPTKFVHFATTSEAAEFEPNVPVERSLTPLSTHVATLRFPTTEPAQLTILEQADRDETKRNHAILQSIDATSDKHTCSRRRRTFVVRRDNNNDGDSAARGRRQKRQRRESFYITERILDAATKVPDDQSDEDDDAVEQLRRRKRRRRESVYWTETSTDPTVNEMFPSLSTNEEATKSLIAKIDDATNGCVESKIHIASLSTQRNPTSRALFGLDG